MNATTDAVRLLRYKLQRLAERGIDGEADSAKRKLARLEARYDFSAPVEQQIDDIFAGVVYFDRGNSRALAITFENNDLASFVKWALKAGFGVDGSIAGAAPCVIVKVEAAQESMATLNHVAKVVRDSFAALWKTFSSLPGAIEKDERCFLLGLYDGMMHDERAQGEKLPQRGGVAKRVTGRKRTLAVAPGLSIHPYEVAVALGGKIRMSVPIGQVVADLSEAERMARLN